MVTRRPAGKERAVVLAGLLPDAPFYRWLVRPPAAWALHIALDIPTHSRDPWKPRFLWPLSDVAMAGISWAEVLVALFNRQ